jgi:hypothetical protein
MSPKAEKDADDYVTVAEFYRQMLKLERRISRLEIIFYINLFLTLATLLRTLLIH